jgi:hypothetical protein
LSGYNPKAPGFAGGYLLADPDKRLIIHHARAERDAIATRVVSEGALRLDPPGIEVSIADLFQA